jgi:hypothetical protein
LVSKTRFPTISGALNTFFIFWPRGRETSEKQPKKQKMDDKHRLALQEQQLLDKQPDLDRFTENARAHLLQIADLLKEMSEVKRELDTLKREKYQWLTEQQAAKEELTKLREYRDNHQRSEKVECGPPKSRHGRFCTGCGKVEAGY